MNSEKPTVAAGEMAQWLTALVAKGPGLILSTHMKVYHLLRHQTYVRCTDAHAGETLIS